MSDPQRLRETTTDDFERSLLASLRGDEPTDGDRRAVLAAVGVVLPATTAAVAGAGAATSWFAGLKATTVAIAVSSVVVVSGVVGTVLATSTSPASPARVEGASATTASSAPATAPPTTTASPASEPASIDVSSLPAAPNASALPTPRASASVAPNAVPQPALTEEIALLDRVRHLLGAGDTTLALTLLDTYDKQPGGLAHEATALRVEALAKSGDKARAAQVARNFLGEHPKSPLAPRIRKLALIGEETIP